LADLKEGNQIPRHVNIIRNIFNIEIFHKEDLQQNDCIGWITVMEKAEEHLRTILKEENISINRRKIIATKVLNGFKYLTSIGLNHYDFKMENILLLNGVPKVIDYGLVFDKTGKESFREMAYVRRGSKFKHQSALCRCHESKS